LCANLFEIALRCPNLAGDSPLFCPMEDAHKYPE
jgi:hypothetical protein